MKKVAIIGAGISGLATARLLCDRFYVTVYEKESTPGGLIRCERIEGSLFHLCGGHVFNSKKEDVLNWFWTFFNREKEFSKADRNSVVFMEDGKEIPYPIENHAYLLDKENQQLFIDDLLQIASNKGNVPTNFEEFLKGRFGKTLYELYFKPYNEKVWRRDLRKVPLAWLEGKLPMPTVEEMIYNNMNHVEEKAFVHATFWYEKQNGSQFIADRLASDLNIQYNSDIQSIDVTSNGILINDEHFDKVVFCGNIKQLPSLLQGVDMGNYTQPIEKLEYHGTTAVFCEIDKNPYSWIYQPSRQHESHRIICTGNFAESNNANDKMTATIEFTDYISEEDIKKELKKIPLNPKYLAHHYNEYTYPIQDKDTQTMIMDLKKYLSQYNVYFTGRFADWEYYNMDVAISAAMKMCKKI